MQIMHPLYFSSAFVLYHLTLELESARLLQTAAVWARAGMEQWILCAFPQRPVAR